MATHAAQALQIMVQIGQLGTTSGHLGLQRRDTTIAPVAHNPDTFLKLGADDAFLGQFGFQRLHDDRVDGIGLDRVQQVNTLPDPVQSCLQTDSDLADFVHLPVPVLTPLRGLVLLAPAQSARQARIAPLLAKPMLPRASPQMREIVADE